MFKRIDSEETAGKTVKRLYFEDNIIILSFTDETYVQLEGEYDSWNEGCNIYENEHSDSYVYYVHRDAGIISEEEYKQILKDRETEQKKRQEISELAQLQLLKEKYEKHE